MEVRDKEAYWYEPSRSSTSSSTVGLGGMMEALKNVGKCGERWGRKVQWWSVMKGKRI